MANAWNVFSQHPKSLVSDNEE